MIEVGSIVILKTPLLVNPIGAIGVCYEEYKIDNGHQGISVIFENSNYDGFSESEQEHFLFEVDYDIIISEYIFSNVLKLNDDFIIGHFDNVFKLSESERQEYTQLLRESKIDSIID